MTFYIAVNHRLGLIACFSPKCATTTLKDWFQYSLAEQKVYDREDIGRHQILPSKIDDYPDYSKILFIRDPFRRLVSFYCHWVVRKGEYWCHVDAEQKYDLHDKSFSEFIHILEDLYDRGIPFQHHLEMQTDNVEHVKFDAVIAVEELKAQLNRLNKKLGLDYAVTALNATTYKGKLADYVFDAAPRVLREEGFPDSEYFYNPQLISKVERVYRDDLKYYRAFHDDKVLFASQRHTRKPKSRRAPNRLFSRASSRSRSSAHEFLCGCLSSSGRDELEDRLVATGQMPAFHWKDFVDLATDYLVAPTVAYRFDQCGLTGRLPDLVERYFDAILRLNRMRNARLRDQAIEITRALNEIDVTPVFLKGCAGLFSGLYEEPGIRTMSDLDILVPTDRGGDCVTKLAEMEYLPVEAGDHPRTHTFASLVGPSETAPVDLHREVLPYPYAAILPVGDLVAQAMTHRVDDVRLAVPSPTHQVIHNIGHTQLNDHGYVYGQLPLQALHDFMLLNQKWGDRIDWRLIDKSFRKSGHQTALAFHCLAAWELLEEEPDFGLNPSFLQRALLRRARFMVNHSTLQRVNDRFLRVILLLRREFSDAELRTRLARNMCRPDWWQRHLQIFWQGGR